jgi:nucleoside diphosphate kinase
MYLMSLFCRELAFFFPDLNKKAPAEAETTAAQEENKEKPAAKEGDQQPKKEEQSPPPPPVKKEEKKSPGIQRTLAIVRPSAFAKHKEAIMKRITDSGFQIAFHKTVTFTRAHAEEFYADQRDKPFFGDLVTEMTSGPMLVLCLVKDNAIQAWRDMLGPKEKDQVKQAAGT